MRIAESILETVVGEVAPNMADPSYVTRRVDQVQRSQPQIMQYVVAHHRELTTEGVVLVLFHAALIIEAITRATGRVPRRVSYADLDRAATTTKTLEQLAQDEAAVASYIASNLDQQDAGADVGRRLLAHVTRACLE